MTCESNFWIDFRTMRRLLRSRNSYFLTLTELISIILLRMRIISTIMNFYLSHHIALQKLSDERSYKFSWILTLTEVISIIILRMRIITAIMNFYWSHVPALWKLSCDRSYKFSWILNLTEVISIRSLTMRIILLNEKSPVKNYSRQTDDRQTTDETAYWNALWVKKIEDIRLIFQDNIDVIVLSETKLDNIHYCKI